MGPGSSYFLFLSFFCLIVAGSSDGSDSSDRSILFGTKTVQHTPARMKTTQNMKMENLLTQYLNVPLMYLDQKPITGCVKMNTVLKYSKFVKDRN